MPLIANYAATKSYLLVLAEGLAAEFSNSAGHANINISIIAPGFTQTALSPEISLAKTPISPVLASDVASHPLRQGIKNY